MIQSSTDLINWNPRLTNSVPLFDYTDSSASNALNRAYRAVLP